MHKFLFLTLFTFLFSQAEITNIQVSQRTDGSQIVDITYDLLEDDLFQVFNITVKYSIDDGQNFYLLLNTNGDVGDGIVAGISKNIVWNMGSQFIDSYFDNMIIDITAESIIASESPFEMVNITSEMVNQCGFEQDINYDYEIMLNEVTNAQYAEFLITELQNGNLYYSSDADGRVVGYFSGDSNYPAGYYWFYAFEEFWYEGNDDCSGEPLYNPIQWNGTTFIVREGMGSDPVSFVSYYGSKAFADFYGHRLPTKNEFAKASSSINRSSYFLDCYSGLKEWYSHNGECYYDINAGESCPVLNSFCGGTNTYDPSYGDYNTSFRLAR